MNCKPGDIAVMLTSTSGANTGRLVRVLSYRGLHEYEKVGRLDSWNVETLSRAYNESAHRWVEAGFIGHFPDKYLRPINPGEELEHITLGAPVRETVAA